MDKKPAVLLEELVSAGMKMRYGDKPRRQVKTRILWELKTIRDAGFSSHYLMAYRIFSQYAQSSGIGVWGIGAMPSSIVCYCLGLTEVDPLRFGLYSERFVNDEPPQFQFDIEKSRYEEFLKGAEEILAANGEGTDIASVRESLFNHLTPMDYLSEEYEGEMPQDLEDEIARYALFFPDTLSMYETYKLRKNGGGRFDVVPYDTILASTYGLLVYQEQMFDILRLLFNVTGIEANQIRRCIQRGDTEQMKTCKARLQSLPRNNRHPYDMGWQDAELAWQMLTDNPKAFLKAHAASRVLAKQRYKTQKTDK